MADIIDQTDDSVELSEEEELGNLEELGLEEASEEPQEATQDEVQEEVAEEEENGYDLPDKFRGRSPEDIAKSYMELEREYGRQSNEVGELRKLTDEILKSSLNINSGEGQSASARKKLEVDDLLEDPETALESALNNSPKLKQLEEQLQQAKREEGRKGFETKHPDAYDLVNSQEMRQWIASSPVRQQMFKDANDNYNYAVADELLTWYKEVTGNKVEQAKEKRKQTRDKALKDAAVEKGTTGQSSKKIYRRTDILKLMRTNPDKYHSPSFQAELEKAYLEGRVR